LAGEFFCQEHFRRVSVQPFMKNRINLDDLRVATPCFARWEDMAGDERARFCGQCSKDVFNLSAMTHGEIERLIQKTEGKFCGRLYQRPDGRMLTADCPAGKMRRRNRLARLGGTLFAAVMFLFGARPLLLAQGKLKSDATNTEPRRLMGEMSVSPARMGDMALPPPMVMGGICAPTNRPTTNSPPALMGKIAMPTQTGQPAPPAGPKK
jgi:hypothetical protein